MTISAVAGLFGLVVGSFLNVVAWRLPRGQSLVRPGSRCPSCRHPVRARDNVPVLSWLVLRGRCRDCAAPISPRYPLVEVLTGLLFAVLAARFGAAAALPAYLYLAAVGVALALVDLDVKRLPKRHRAPVVRRRSRPARPRRAGRRRRGGAGPRVGRHGGAVHRLLLLALAYPAGMGFGDVKLSGVLGLYLGYLGVAELVVGAFAGFLLGGLTGAVLVALGRAGSRSAIPFGPFMLAGALVGVLAGRPLAAAYLSAAVG